MIHNKKNKNFVYLISPSKIENHKFYNNLSLVLKSGKVCFFQLRLKNETNQNKLIIGKKIKFICKKYKVKFIVNDDPLLAKKLNADGCHIGQEDTSIINAKQIIKKKIVGITCHNKRNLAKKAEENGADYLAFGAFFKTETKNVKYFANIGILKWAKKNIKIPIVAIGGINDKNFKSILKNGADYIAISSYVWSNKNYSPLKAIKKLYF